MVKLLDLLRENNRGDYEYGCAMMGFHIQKMNEIHAQIDKKHLHEYGLEKEHHVTLLYGILPTVPIKNIKSVLELYDFSGDCLFTNASLFENGEYDVLKFDAHAFYLHLAHKGLQFFPHETSYPDYKPHMTIAYLKSGFGELYKEKFSKLEFYEKPTSVYYKKPDGGGFIISL